MGFLDKRLDHSAGDQIPSSGAKPALLQKAKNYTRSKDVKAQGLYPYFRPISSAQDTEVTIEGQKVLMLGSNSYLGLTNHPEIKAAVQSAVEKYGSGCAGSRFLNGTLDIHLELEMRLAELVNKESVLLFSTGFQANFGTIGTMVGRGETVIADKEDHASIMDGCLLSFGKFLRFAHNDMNSLENCLRNIPVNAGKLIVVDGVFSMSGEIAPLDEIVSLAETYGAAVMVDDAHGIGVLGQNGAGTCDSYGLADRVHIIMGTFSKSLASLGGFIAADDDIVEYLKHNCRSLIFSASMTPGNIAAVLQALRIMQREPERIERLWENTRLMREGLLNLGFNLGTSQTPILPIFCYQTEKALIMAMRLHQEGVFVNPVLPPGVPPTKSLIRVSLMATHTESQIHLALEKLEKVGKELELI
jgi:8-amino-7-oxononanoate synthase